MRQSRTNNLAIRTPDGVVFSYQLAGPLQRLLALLIDQGVIISGIVMIGVVGALFSSIFSFISRLGADMGGAIAMVGSFVMMYGYMIFAEWKWQGVTIGKKVMGLKVMDEQGLKLRFYQVVIRNLLRVVDSIGFVALLFTENTGVLVTILVLGLFLYAIGGVVMLFSRYQQRLGDLAANTVVIQVAKETRPDLAQILGDKFNSFREHPHLVARLRQLVGPQEAALAVRALTRRDQFDPDARASLFKEFADHFRTLVRFPEETVLGISDERYVQNVIDVVYRKT